MGFLTNAGIDWLLLAGSVCLAVGFAASAYTKLERQPNEVQVIANTGFDKVKANAVIGAGLAGLVVFGVPYIANPDLVARYRTDATHNSPAPTNFYGIGPKGYTDYSFLVG